jgi:hypothetical protein
MYLMDKKIVYLDQNILSFIAKVELGQIKDERVEKLSNSLKTRVQEDKILCPQSLFHTIESHLSSETLKQKIMATLKNLSCGLVFRDWKDLLDIQMQRAIDGFFASRPTSLSKDEAFCNEATLETHATSLSDFERLKQLYKERWEGLRKEVLEGYQRGLPELTNKLFRQHRERERQALIKGYLLQPDREPCLSTYIMEAYHLEGPRKNGLETYKLFDPDIKRLDAFTGSGWLRAVPFVDIVSSVNAGILVYEEAREPEEGDFYDSLIVGTVLPYCDVLVTDNFIKSILVKRLGYHKKYHVEVFSGKGSELERLLEYLERVMVP